MPLTPPSVDRILRVRGTVQGVGFRPFVAREATTIGLRGWVRNDAQGVLIRASGTARQLDQLADAVTHRAPAAAIVTSIEWSDPRPELPPIDGAFVIIGSGKSVGEIATNVPVDLAPCPDCRRELESAGDRRHGYAFINCTQCGPRYSIIESLPYDRPRTTMQCFRMCPACAREYRDPADRRFHAEPNACPACGPELQLRDANGNLVAHGPTALTRAATALLNGKIVAVKGTGGFHLLVDAQHEAGVAELRRRKHREQKPLAVMFADVAMAGRWAEVSAVAAARLQTPQAPIVLVPRRPSPALAAEVAPGNPWIGALLPNSPVHLLLLAALKRPVVATSANLSDEPLCTDDDQARQRLAGIADLFLGNTRPIARPVDDSVVRFSPAGAAILLRRARGYAPGPLILPAALDAPLVCVGAQMKNTVAIGCDRRLVLSPHIGDLDGVATYGVFTRTIETLSALFDTRPARVVCDKHPDYTSTRWALGCGLPAVAVQHHLAHVLAVLLEHGHDAQNVLGVAWDGTGYGEDGTIWGGEFFLLRDGQALRFARLRPFRLPGGDAAVKDPRRVALSLALAADAPGAANLGTQLGFMSPEVATLSTMLTRGINSPVSSSVGRLFDGFGALLGISRRNAFEGQTPLAVEIAAHRGVRRGAGTTLPLPLRPADAGAVWEVDWQPAVDEILSRRKVTPEESAAALHRGLAAALTAVAEQAGVPTVVLSGGCFQNALLRDLAEQALAARRFRVLAPQALPPNDGAIAAGQALGALWNLTSVSLPSSRRGGPS